MQMTKERWTIVVICALMAVAVGAYVVFYAPLMKDLKTNYLECKAMEADVLETRSTIESAGKTYGKRILMTEEGISQAIDELTRRGKSEGINFISISPKEVEKGDNSEYKVLPIDMEIESGYKELAVFMGSLDEMDKGLVKVKSFEITADEDDPSRLVTELSVDMYFSARGGK